MTTPTRTFNLTRNQIITRAFNVLNVFEPNESISADDINLGADFLNMMVKHWAAHGIHLFQKETGYLFFQYNQNKYLVDGSTAFATTSYIQTTQKTMVSSGTTVVITSTAGMAANDNIGFVLDSGTIFWTTINTVSNSTNLILNASIPSSVTAGNQVYDIGPTLIDKPLKVHYAFRRDTLTNTDTPMATLSNSDYYNLPVKGSLGTPLEFYYDCQVSNGDLLVWPTPNSVTTIMGFTYDKRINDLNFSTDTPDFPNEWLMSLVYNLAVYLAPIYGKYIELNYVQPLAKALLEEVKSFDQEEANIVLKPSSRNKL